MLISLQERELCLLWSRNPWFYFLLWYVQTFETITQLTSKVDNESHKLYLLAPAISCWQWYCNDGSSVKADCVFFDSLFWSQCQHFKLKQHFHVPNLLNFMNFIKIFQTSTVYQPDVLLKMTWLIKCLHVPIQY